MAFQQLRFQLWKRLASKYVASLELRGKERQGRQNLSVVDTAGHRQ